MTRAALLTALLLLSPAALRAGDEGKGDHNEDGHPDNGRGRGGQIRGGGRRWWGGRTDYTRIRDPEPQTVVVAVPEGETPYRRYAWGHMTSTTASNYKAKVRNCGGPGCAVWQTTAVAVALPVSVVLDVPFFVGRVIAWPFRRRS